MRTLPLLSLVCLPLTGCGRIGTVLDVIDELVSPTVADGLYVGVELPDGVDFGFSDDFAVSACEVFLASVDDPAAFDDAPVEGAKLKFRSDENSGVTFDEQGEGKYRATSMTGLRYVPNDLAMVDFEGDGGSGTISVLPPDAPDATVPGTATANKGFEVETDVAYENLLVAVYNVDDGTITYSNLPESVEDIYAYTHPEGPISTLDVPGEAIARKGTYVVGVAGMELADPDDFESVNVSLSAFMAGRFEVHLMSVSAAE